MRYPLYTATIQPYAVTMARIGDGSRSSQQPGQCYAIVDSETGKWLCSATCLMSAADARYMLSDEYSNLTLKRIDVAQLDLFPHLLRLQ